MVDYRQQRLGVPPPPPGSMAMQSPLLAQGLAMPPQGPPSTIGGYAPPMQPQMDMPGPGIGHVMPPMAPTPQMETGPEPQIGMQPQVIQTPPATPQGNLYDDPETIKLQQQAYKKALASFGGAGATPEEARQQKALSLFGNIIAPAMAAFGKGGVSAAGVQLMNKAQNDIQAKKSEHKQSQNDAIQALTMLNNMSKIRNDDFHKQTMEEMKAKMITDKEDRDKQNAEWKKHHQDTLDQEARNKADWKKREDDFKARETVLKENESKGKIDLNKSKTDVNNANAKEIPANAISKRGLEAIRGQNIPIFSAAATKAAENGATNAATKQNPPTPPAKPVSPTDEVKTDFQVRKEWRLAKAHADRNGTAQPPDEESFVAQHAPHVTAAQLPDPNTDPTGFDAKLQKIPRELRANVMAEAKKLHGNK